MSLTYLAYDLATRAYWGDLTPYVSGVVWDDPVGADEYGSWSASLHVDRVKDTAVRSRILERLINDRTWVLVVDSGTREILWSGILRSKAFDRRERARALTAVQMPWWLHHRLVGTGASPRVWTDADRLVIARQLVQTTGAGRYGDPAIIYDAALSGKRINYRVDARSFSSIASHLVESGRGRDGYEWDLITERSPYDGLPRLRFIAAHPEITNSPIHLFHYATGQTNLIGFPDVWPDSSHAAYARVWATGEGSGAGMSVGSDTDPFTRGDGYRPATGADWRRLLTEKTTSYSGVRSPAALVANAREERLALAKVSEPVTVTVSDTRPPLASYGKGSRAHVIVSEPDFRVDAPATRVTNVRYTHDAQAGGARVELTLDLNDIDLPDGLRA